MRTDGVFDGPDFRLLLTVARVLRAKIKDEVYAERDGDLEALNEALAPFDPLPCPLYSDECQKASSEVLG